MNDALDPIRKALNEAAKNPPRTTRLATVTSTTGGISVQFDGEGSASSKKYLRLNGCTCTVGLRVLMIRAGSTWVVAGGVAA